MGLVFLEFLCIDIAKWQHPPAKSSERIHENATLIDLLGELLHYTLPEKGLSAQSLCG